MGKKLLILSLLLSMTVAQAAQAQTIKWIDFKQIPDLKTGAAYSIRNSNFNHTETAELVRWKALSLNGGYAGDADKVDHKLIGTLSVDLLKIGDYVKFPILDKVIIQPFIWYGTGNINLKDVSENQADWGVGSYILQVRF